MASMLRFDDASITLRSDQGEGQLDHETLDELGRFNVAVSIHVGTEGSGHRLDTTVRHTGATAVLVDHVDLEFHAPCALLLEHGWQSWSTVRRARSSDVRPRRAEAPRWLNAEMSADPTTPGTRLVCDTFVLSDTYIVGALDERTAFTSYRVDGDQLTVRFHLDGLRIEPEGSVLLPPLLLLDGEAGTTYSTYCELAGSMGDALVDRAAPTGWCSWYQYFGDVTADHVVANADLAAAHGLALVQIDDGWQESIGSWGATAPRFGTPIEELASQIVHDGGVAGLWSAPFLCLEGSSLATEHPDWLVTHPDGRPVTALVHGGWGGAVFALDTSRDDVCEHLEATYAALAAKGFEYHKVDFLFAAAISGRRHGDGTMTRAQAYRRGLEAVRRGIGDDAYLLGCGAPLLASVGLVDAMRVSEDVAPYWEPRGAAPDWEECVVAARNAIEQSTLRAPMHRRWFVNDPDCVLLRPVDTELSPSERATLAAAVLGAGAYLVFSDDLATYTEAEWATVDRLLALQTLADTPLDLVDPFATVLEVRGGHLRLEVALAERRAQLFDAAGAVITL